MRKGVILLVVTIVLVVLSAFAVIVLYFMSNQARVSEHKIGRMKAFYTAQGAILDAQKRLANDEDRNTVESSINSNFKMNNLNVSMVIRTSEEGDRCGLVGEQPGSYCLDVPPPEDAPDEVCSALADQYCIAVKVDY